ncbi:hypothetical protein [Mucilaginibacter sp.]
MTALLITPDVLPCCTLYILLQWPYVQDLMEQSWFQSDCILYQPTQDQEHLPQAYFIPMERFAEAIQQKLIVLEV